MVVMNDPEPFFVIQIVVVDERKSISEVVNVKIEVIQCWVSPPCPDDPDSCDPDTQRKGMRNFIYRWYRQGFLGVIFLGIEYSIHNF